MKLAGTTPLLLSRVIQELIFQKLKTWTELMLLIISTSGPPAELIKDAHKARTKMFCLHIVEELTYCDA